MLENEKIINMEDMDVVNGGQDNNSAAPNLLEDRPCPKCGASRRWASHHLPSYVRFVCPACGIRFMYVLKTKEYLIENNYTKDSLREYLKSIKVIRK